MTQTPFRLTPTVERPKRPPSKSQWNWYVEPELPLSFGDDRQNITAVQAIFIVVQEYGDRVPFLWTDLTRRCRKRFGQFRNDSSFNARYGELTGTGHSSPASRRRPWLVDLGNGYGMYVKQRLPLFDMDEDEPEPLFAVPETYARVRKPRTRKTGQARPADERNRHLVAPLLHLQDCTCALCGWREERVNHRYWHVDHIKAYSKGGRLLPGNYQLLCLVCNGIKATHDMPRAREDCIAEGWMYDQHAGLQAHLKAVNTDVTQA